MAQLSFHLDADLLDVFNRLMDGGAPITPEAILLIQVLRRLDEHGEMPGEHSEQSLGIDLVPTPGPAPAPPPPADPQSQDLADMIRRPNQIMMQSMADDIATPADRSSSAADSPTDQPGQVNQTSQANPPSQTSDADTPDPIPDPVPRPAPPPRPVVRRRATT